MPSGYLYVLTNPTMPGLSKVGKTTRQPADRVAELSGATGVASPFILIFQQPVDECDSAENWVHIKLERRGFRHANNREFFNGPIHEIISVIVAAVNISAASPKVKTQANLDSSIKTNELANELVEMAVDALMGTDEVIENESKSRDYYKQAAALNHVFACRCVGKSHQFGLSGKINNELALDYYRKAIHHGGWESEACMADLFFQVGKIAAAQNHWLLFFEHACEEFGGVPLQLAQSKNNRAYPSRLNSRVYTICDNGAHYCQLVASGKLDQCVSSFNLGKIKSYIEFAINRKIKFFSDSKYAHMFTKSVQEWQAAMDYLNSYATISAIENQGQ